MSQGAEWKTDLCGDVCGGDCNTCMGAWFCPCCLFGRESARLEQFPDTSKPGYCNGDCMVLGLTSLCHLGWIPTMLKRMEERRKFGIGGNGCYDCMVAYFCFPCALAQMDTEVKAQAKFVQTNQGYASQQRGMVYEEQKV